MTDLHSNIGYSCTTGQVAQGAGGNAAFHWLSATMERGSWSFTELDRESNRFANVQERQDHAPGPQGPLSRY